MTSLSAISPVSESASPGSTACVTSRQEGDIVWVHLSNLARFNAMTRAMWRQLREVFQALQARAAQPDAPRVVIVTGEQGHFCAGGDISEYPAFRFDAAQLRHFHEEEVWGALSAMLACELPVVAAIEGNCMGAGVEIASCCDIRIAAHSARFGAPIARLGFPMAPRELQLVGGALGATVARAMLLEAAVYDAAALVASGFLTRLAEPGEVQAAARDSAMRMASLSPLAARLHKRSLRALAEGGQAWQQLLAQAYDYASEAEHREGITAFLEKRKPLF